MKRIDSVCTRSRRHRRPPAPSGVGFWIWGAAAALVLSLATATPAAAAECPDADGDDFVVCGGCEVPEGKECGDCDDDDASVNPDEWGTCADFVAPMTGASPCPDNDGDNFAVCGGCDLPGGKQCGDCNDANANINPGEDEVCNGIDDDCDGLVDLDDPEFNDPDPIDGVDNDTDGEVDEGFERCLFAESGPGCTGTLPAEADCCKTGGATQCIAGALTCVNPNNQVITYSPEDDPNGPACSDGINNDCDCDSNGGACGPLGSELIDLDDPGCQQPELCDGLDNDGDGFVDEDFPLGDPNSVGGFCTAGVGECQQSGNYACLPDKSDAVCSATPASPKSENPQAGLSCGNGKDDDCDGLIDLADPDCAGFGDPELCGNNIDDDGDGLIDEGFPTIGVQCAAGVGACTTIGELVCNGAGTGTECNAVPGSPSVEGSDNAGTCTDVLDNDCDGLVDAADPDCGATYADLGVTCSLPYRLARPGDDCTGKHIIEFGADSGDATVKADLLALDVDGTLLAVIENVQPGEEAHLASRLDPADWHHSSKTNKRGTRHTVWYPIPLLRVTATTGAVEDVAYCGILPYLEVTQPDGVTLSLSEGDSLDVSGYLPLTDVDTLAILLNGEDVLAGAGIDPATDFPTGDTPLCPNLGDCQVQIEAGCGDGTLVDVDITNLRVEGLDTALAFDAKEGVGAMEQVNTISFTVSGLPPGGHIFYLQGDPLPLPPDLDEECNVDDLADAGTASAFGITIASPLDQQVVASAPVTVEGTVCGGNEIVSFGINGHPVDVSIPANQTCTTGDGMTSADECVVDFSEPIGETDLQQAVDGMAPIGTFKRGSNRIIADAIDNEGNRTFNTEVIFGLGDVQSPAAAAALQLGLSAEKALGPAYAEALKAFTTTLDPAFVVGLEESAAQDFFNEKCSGAIEEFTTRATANLNNKSFGDIDIKPDCSCDLNNVPLVLEDLDFTLWNESVGGPTCAVDFEPEQIEVTIHLPDIRIQIGVHDSCTTRGLFGECLARTRIDVTAVTKIEDITFDFTITEEQIETKTLALADSLTFAWAVRDNDDNELFPNPGTCEGVGGSCFFNGECAPSGGNGKCSGGPDKGNACTTNSDCAVGNFGSCTGGDNNAKFCTADTDCPGGTCDGKCVGVCDITKNPAFDPVTVQNSTIECWGATLCTAFEVIGAVFITAFTFGLVDGFEVIDFLEFDVDFAEDFLDDLAASNPDPLELDEVEVDPDKVSAFGDTSFTPLGIDVEIEDGGLTVAFGAEFTVDETDPEIDDTPPPPATPAAVPTVPAVIAAGDEISVLVADDVFGQVFAAMRQAGRLQAFCTPSDGLTVDDLLPAEIDGGCDSLLADSTLPNVVKAPARGLCHGIRGADCESLLGPSITLTALEQGVCHGFQDVPDCTMLSTGFDGIQLPADCDTIGLSADDSEDPEFNPGRSTLISQGRCWGLKMPAVDCETLTSGGTAQDTAFKQGACHGEQGAVCDMVPTTVGAAAHEIGTCAAVQGSCAGLGPLSAIQCGISLVQVNLTETVLRLAEEQACTRTPSRNIEADDGLLLCARQDMEPELLFADDDASDNTVNTSLVLNDTSVVFALDRANDGYTGSLEALQGCFGDAGDAAADCLLFSACLDLAIDTRMGIDNSTCSPDQTGFVFDILSIVIPPNGADLGVLCSAATASEDQLVTGEGFNSDVITVLSNNSEAFAPPFCADGLTLGGVLDFTSDDAKLFALTTDEVTPGFADYLGLTGGLGPPNP